MLSFQGSTRRNLYACSVRLQEKSAESFDSGRGSQRCGSSDFSLEEIRHERARDCKEAVCAGNPDTFYTPLSAGIPEKHLAGKGPSMADRVRDKGAGKSNLHRNNGL